MNFLKKLYHIVIKRDLVTRLYTKRFGSFGANSILYKPLIIRGKKYINIGQMTTILNGSRIQIYNDLTGLNSKIVIGNNCYIGYNNSFLVGEDIILEDGVLLASNKIGRAHV